MRGRSEKKANENAARAQKVQDMRQAEQSSENRQMLEQIDGYRQKYDQRNPASNGAGWRMFNNSSVDDTHNAMGADNYQLEGQAHVLVFGSDGIMEQLNDIKNVPDTIGDTNVFLKQRLEAITRADQKLESMAANRKQQNAAREAERANQAKLDNQQTPQPMATNPQPPQPMATNPQGEDPLEADAEQAAGISVTAEGGPEMDLILQQLKNLCDEKGWKWDEKNTLGSGQISDASGNQLFSYSNEGGDKLSLNSNPANVPESYTAMAETMMEMRPDKEVNLTGSEESRVDMLKHFTSDEFLNSHPDFKLSPKNFDNINWDKLSKEDHDTLTSGMKSYFDMHPEQDKPETAPMPEGPSPQPK